MRHYFHPGLDEKKCPIYFAALIIRTGSDLHIDASTARCLGMKCPLFNPDIPPSPIGYCGLNNSES